MPSITPNLWFDGNARDAAEHYCSVFPNSRIVKITPYPEGTGPAGRDMTVEWELDGTRFVGLNGGPEFTFNEAISLQVDCEDQAEIDHYWEELSAGGEEGPCGWLKDRFGVSWQIVPAGIHRLYDDADPARASRAMQAMQQMRKLDIAGLQAAADGAVPA